MPRAVIPDDVLRQFRALQQRPALAFTIGLAALLIVTWGLYGPPLAAIQRATRTWEHLRDEVEEARRVGDRIRQETVPPLPTLDTLPTTLAALSVVARDHQIQLVTVTPGPARAPDANGVVVVPIELDAVGEYRALGEWLEAVGHAPTLGVALVRRVAMDREESFLPRLRAHASIECLFYAGDAHGSS